MEHLPDHIEPSAVDHDDEDSLDLPFLTDAGSEVTAADGQAGYAVIEWHQGQPVPNLNEIERASTSDSPKPRSASAPSPGSSRAS